MRNEKEVLKFGNRVLDILEQVNYEHIPKEVCISALAAIYNCANELDHKSKKPGKCPQTIYIQN